MKQGLARLVSAESTRLDKELVTNSLLFAAMSRRAKEVNEHKWYESERVGYDIGFDRALLNWVIRYSQPLRSSCKK